MSRHADRMSLGDYARREGLPAFTAPLSDFAARRAALVLWNVRVASLALADGARLALIGERRALSESEAADAIRAGRVVEVVT